jgi:serpin B
MRGKLANCIWLLALSALVLPALALAACGTADTPQPAPLPTKEPAEVVPESEVPIPDPARARDEALAYLAGAHGAEALAEGLSWTEENATAEGLVGASTFVYESGDWSITVEFPVVAPEATIYHIAVENTATGFRWEGEVNAMGKVTEVAVPEEEAETPPGLAQAGLVQADVKRETAPAVSEGDLAALVGGNSTFAFELYQALRGAEGNLFYSPHSISVALAMTYAGARTETEEQMAGTLRYTLPQEQLHPAFNGLDLELASRGEGAQGKDGKGFRLSIVNAIWGQDGYPFLPQFLDTLARNYGAGLRIVDFVNATEAARLTINNWVSEQTEGRIEDLIPPGSIDAATRLVLTNAIYFNAAWAEPFLPEQTQDGTFHLLDDGEVTVPLMSQSTLHRYAEGDGYQAVEVAYDGHELSMLILLPEEGNFEAFEQALDAGQVEAIVEALGHQQVALTLPSFEFDAKFSLEKTLAEMGMPLAFSPDADFSGMTGTRELFISQVIHQAFVSVDEAGTEAAAATAVMMKLSAAPGEPIEFRADHPFIFLIRDNETGAILFVGRVVNPDAS